MDAEELRQDLNDAARTDAAGHVDRQALTRPFVDHGEAFQGLPIGTGVEQEVVGSHVIRRGGRQRPMATRRRGRRRGTCSPAWRQSRCVRSGLIAWPSRFKKIRIRRYP